MIEFTFYSTKPEDFSANSDGCKVATKRVANAEDGLGNETHVVEATKQAALPPGTYVAVQTASDNPKDIIGWGWLVQVVAPTTPQVQVLE